MDGSEAIDAAVEKAVADGNGVAEISTGWSRVRKVVYMRAPMSDGLRAQLKADTRLAAWSAEATPHYAAEEGFIDEAALVSIAFPKAE